MAFFFRKVAFLLGLVLSFLGPAYGKKPEPNFHRVLGFNDGSPFKMDASRADALLSLSDVSLYCFQDLDWMKKSSEGAWMKANALLAAWPSASPSDFFEAYQLELEGRVVLVLPKARLSKATRCTPSFLRLKDDETLPLFASISLLGQHFRVLDIRDLNGDGKPEVLLLGEAGKAGAYQFLSVVAHVNDASWQSLDVPQEASLHYAQFVEGQEHQLVERQRVGRRGAASDWTYVDRLFTWNGKAFVSADKRFYSYHDEVSIPRLMADLMAHAAASQALLNEKLQALKDTRQMVLAWVKKPAKHRQDKLKALNLLERGKPKEALKLLLKVDAGYAYDSQVLVAIAEVYSLQNKGEDLLAYALRAISAEPEASEAWWWAGLGFSLEFERSLALSSFVLSARLSGDKESGLAFLRARRAKRGMEGELQSILDEAIQIVKER